MNNRDNTKEAEEILSRISAELTRQNRMQAELVAYLDLPKGVIATGKPVKAGIFANIWGRYQNS